MTELKEGGALATTDASRAKSGVVPGLVEDPIISSGENAFDIVEWRQTNLEEYYDRHIDTMEKAIILGKQFKLVGERCEIAIGKLANHVEKGKWGGGISAFARGIGLPLSTVYEWASATRTEELSERSENLGTSKVAIIEQAPDEVKEIVWEWVDEQEKEPSYRDIARKVRETKIEQEIKNNDVLPREDIIHDSIENILEYLEPESVDLIVTDPPYPEEFLPLWETLAQRAAIVLKPGGFLISYSGHIHLPRVIHSLSRHLKYVWIIALLHSGPAQAIHPRRIHAKWKPILVYCKEPYTPQDEYLYDVLQGTGKEKDGHPWQQALGEAEELITRFSRPKDLVVDPFLGSGTTVLAAKNTGRNFFGMDTDELAVKTTLGRLSE